ncbi:MAG: Lrp/AsnC family transcriptional regulator [Hyphomicrobiales bacterium]|nr:Lrp/AsnC family transcriptional regulator [Hyphomicrobiales bacterium]
MDALDLKILDLLQKDCTMAVADIGKAVGLSTTPCWRRIQKLESDGVILGRVALINPKAVNAGVTVFVSVTTPHHSLQWLDKFTALVQTFPEIIEAYRMSGDVDYLLRVVVPDIQRFDEFYRRLITSIELHDVSSSFAMEQIKFTTAMPLKYVGLRD